VHARLPWTAQHCCALGVNYCMFLPASPRNLAVKRHNSLTDLSLPHVTSHRGLDNFALTHTASWPSVEFVFFGTSNTYSRSVKLILRLPDQCV